MIDLPILHDNQKRADEHLRRLLNEFFLMRGKTGHISQTIEVGAGSALLCTDAAEKADAPGHFGCGQEPIA